MATGAFPVGLRWRPVHRKGKYLNDSKIISPKVDRPLHNIKPEEIFSTVNVDGGMLNNEPFDIAQKLFSEKFRNRNLSHKEITGASILMIDPFPSVEDEVQIVPQSKIRLKTIIGEIYSTMRTQLLVKPGDLEEATDGSFYNRFLMAPTRTFTGRGKVIGSKAIACGSLDGFGGFLTKDFRTHDFQLGRRNCQQFLRKHFVMPFSTKNPIVAAGYCNPAAEEAFREEIVNEATKVISYVLPIIPDISLENGIGKVDNEEKPAFPVYNETTIRDLVSKNDEAIKARLKAVVEDNELLNFNNLFISLLTNWLDDKASEAIGELIIKDLKNHHLIHDSN